MPRFDWLRGKERGRDSAQEQRARSRGLEVDTRMYISAPARGGLKALLSAEFLRRVVSGGKQESASYILRKRV